MQRANHSNLLRRFSQVALMIFGLLLLLAVVPQNSYAAGAVHETGTIHGSTYVLDLPSNWNGTLLLYSHGYAFPMPAETNPAMNAGDDLTRNYLLGQGYALAGTSYGSPGWAVKDAIQDQMDLLNYFEGRFLATHHLKGQYQHAIAWGHSLGGMITAGLIQKYPHRFAGALSMGGVLAGSVGTWNLSLDGIFAFKTLLGQGTGLQITNITDPQDNLNLAYYILNQAMASPEGRARVALVAAIANIPGWFDATQPEPGPADFGAQLYSQVNWFANLGFPLSFAFRAELESRAGGNPSWNTGVNYYTAFERSINKQETLALYAAAGLNPYDDLQILQNAPRISADPQAVAFLQKYITFDGRLDVPVLTIHNTADGLIIVQEEEAFTSLVAHAGYKKMLRQTYINRPGHASFTPAETVAALKVLENRVANGKWSESSLDPAQLNAAALALGPLMNVSPPQFAQFTPTAFPRPYPRK